VDDWPRIWPIWRAIALAGETIAWDPATPSEQARESWLGPGAGDVFVAEDDRAIVGSAQLHPNYARPAASRTRPSSSIPNARDRSSAGGSCNIFWTLPLRTAPIRRTDRPG
jgi:hypothetical protein